MVHRLDFSSINYIPACYTDAEGSERANKPHAPFYFTSSRLRRGYTMEATPVPIPNTAVKLHRADDTSWHTGGKVGRRDVKNPESPQSQIWGLSSFDRNYAISAFSRIYLTFPIESPAIWQIEKD